ncbi:hypothetical protein FOZ62_005293, partial [Perkinsus olseni]
MPAAAATTNASKANEDSLQHSKAFTDEDSNNRDLVVRWYTRSRFTMCGRISPRLLLITAGGLREGSSGWQLDEGCGEDRPRRTAPISTTASDSSGDATVDSADDARTPWPAYGPQDGALTTLSDDRQAGETRQQ